MLNRLDLQCRMVADPEPKETNSGTKVVNFRVAWSETVREKENKLFLECKAFSGLAEHIAKYFPKGKEMVISGKLNTEEWTNQDGQNRSKIVLMVSEINFCGKKQSGENTQTDSFGESKGDGLPF